MCKCGGGLLKTRGKAERKCAGKTERKREDGLCESVGESSLKNADFGMPSALQRQGKKLFCGFADICEKVDNHALIN